MGSVKLKDLKAFVRYDGSGRVVSGSLIFRKKKPKNGRWSEITKNLCCTESGTTTTTTTQGGGGGATPTAWIATPYDSEFNACNNMASAPTLILYTSTSTISVNTDLWQDAALTQRYSPAMGTYYISFAGDSNKYSIATMLTTYISSILPC